VLAARRRRTLRLHRAESARRAKALPSVNQSPAILGISRNRARCAPLAARSRLCHKAAGLRSLCPASSQCGQSIFDESFARCRADRQQSRLACTAQRCSELSSRAPSTSRIREPSARLVGLEEALCAPAWPQSKRRTTRFHGLLLAARATPACRAVQPGAGGARLATSRPNTIASTIPTPCHHRGCSFARSRSGDRPGRHRGRAQALLQPRPVLDFVTRARRKPSVVPLVSLPWCAGAGTVSQAPDDRWGAAVEAFSSPGGVTADAHPASRSGAYRA